MPCGTKKDALTNLIIIVLFEPMKTLLISGLVFGYFILSVSHVWASTLDPFFDDAPASFVVHGYDSFSGVTVSGYVFNQYRIVSDASIRIHRFTVADRFFYISDHGVIEAENDLSAISIYLTRLS